MQIKFLFICKSDDYRLIQVLWHKYAFVFFYIIVIWLEEWLIDTVNLLKY